jgi:hypothetical protein
MKQLILISAALGLLILSLEKAALGQSQSQIWIHVADTYGAAVHAERITIRADGAPREVRQDQPISVAYGRYIVETSVPGFDNATDFFVVDQPAQVIAVMMKLGSVEGNPPPSCSVKGHCRQKRERYGCAWCNFLVPMCETFGLGQPGRSSFGTSNVETTC